LKLRGVEVQHFASEQGEIPSQFELCRFVREPKVENAESDFIETAGIFGCVAGEALCWFPHLQ
jgi:hypothetical protein